MCCADQFYPPPKAFSTLLGKLLPLQLHADVPAGTSAVNINIVAVPPDRYLSAEEAGPRCGCHCRSKANLHMTEGSTRGL